MAKGFINDSTLTAIADAIRAKLETSDEMLPGDMAGLIEAINTCEYRITHGVITWSSAINLSAGAEILSHGLGEKPDVIVFWTATRVGQSYKTYVHAYLYDADFSENTVVMKTQGAESSWEYVTGSIANDTHILSTRNGFYQGSFRWFAMKKVV